MFGPRNSAYALLDTTDIQTHTHIYYIYIHISREISIEHPSVGLASLAQLHTSKEKSIKINAKIEDVGLTEHYKSMETRNGHYIFMIKKIYQNPAYCFFVLHSIKIKYHHVRN